MPCHAINDDIMFFMPQGKKYVFIVLASIEELCTYECKCRFIRSESQLTCLATKTPVIHIIYILFSFCF